MQTARTPLILGAGVRLPIGRADIDAREEEARLRGLQAQAEADAFRLDQAAEAEQIRAQLEGAEEALALIQTTLLPQTATLLESLRLGYGAGTTPFLARLDAERTLFELRLEAVELEHRLLTLRARLAYILGLSLTR